MIPSILRKSVRYRKVSAIKHVRYREVPLYNNRPVLEDLMMDTPMSSVSLILRVTDVQPMGLSSGRHLEPDSSKAL